MNNIFMFQTDLPTSRQQTKRASYTGAVLDNSSSLVRSELLSVVRQSPVNVALFNARSVNNKALLLSDIICHDSVQRLHGRARKHGTRRRRTSFEHFTNRTRG